MDDLSELIDRLNREAGYRDAESPEPDAYCAAMGGDFLRAAAAALARLRSQLAAAETRADERQRERDDLRDWMRAANQFAWAHEQTCPRHDADLPCNCGLDEFLARPKRVIESVKTLRAQHAQAVEALREMTAACAAAMRVISQYDTGAASPLTTAFETELRQAGVKNGFGVRANEALKAASTAKAGLTQE